MIHLFPVRTVQKSPKTLQCIAIAFVNSQKWKVIFLFPIIINLPPHIYSLSISFLKISFSLSEYTFYFYSIHHNTLPHIAPLSLLSLSPPTQKFTDAMMF